MKTISRRELHEETGGWVRRARRHGEILVTDRGRAVAKIVPQEPEPQAPYFSRRNPSPRFRAIMDELEGGTDSTQTISEDRDRHAS